MLRPQATLARNPSGTLLPFLGSGFPYIIYQQKKGYPYCNMVTGLPSWASDGGRSQDLGVSSDFTSFVWDPHSKGVGSFVSTLGSPYLLGC